MMASRFTVLLPVKAPGRGKSRLALPDRAALVHAFVLDTIAALRASSYVDQVLVVSDDPDAGFGVPVLPDAGGGDLNRALRRAADEAGGEAIAAMLPDLPALRTRDVDAALSRVDRGRWFVADHGGTGTTLLAAAGVPLEPAFGADSAARHRSSGAVEIAGDLVSLRLDVDTAEDLHVAVALGVGKNTAAVLPRQEAPPQRQA